MQFTWAKVMEEKRNERATRKEASKVFIIVIPYDLFGFSVQPFLDITRLR